MIQQQVKQEFPTLEDIHAAAERLDGLVVKTPFVFSETISKTLGAEMWLKFEIYNLRLLLKKEAH